MIIYKPDFSRIFINEVCSDFYIILFIYVKANYDYWGKTKILKWSWIIFIHSYYLILIQQLRKLINHISNCSERYYSTFPIYCLTIRTTLISSSYPLSNTMQMKLMVTSRQLRITSSFLANTTCLLLFILI